jgi:penicillin-binding protein 2
MSKEEYSRIVPHLKSFNGFDSKRRTNRGYPYGVAAHVLGYVRKISAEQYYADQNGGERYYNQNDYVGVTGLEKVYEKELRGERGSAFFLRDYAGNDKTNLEETYAIAGNSLYTSLDVKLQAYGELLMKNKLGSIVAIEPSTGEILAMISAPSFDPNKLSGREFSENYQVLLNNDTLKPIINRPIYNDNYRPGSIFKLVQALIAMQEGVILENTGFACNKALINCHNHEDPSNVQIAIKHSCNPYFYQVYKRLIQRGEESSIFKDSRLGIEKWNASVKSFGLGTKLNTDIPGVKTGRIPDANYYDNEFPSKSNPYGKHKWAFSTIYSNSIGEGEIGVSPLQMANLAAIIANRGYYYTPHLVKKIGENGSKRSEYLKKNFTMAAAKYFDPVVNAMEMVVDNGTARAAKIDSISVCGKTGTVQNETFNDHSVFIAFAPKENPQIAIAVYVEYGTWGGVWAAKIASLMIEKYLLKELSEQGKKKEQQVLDAVILDKHSDFK